MTDRVQDGDLATQLHDWEVSEVDFPSSVGFIRNVRGSLIVFCNLVFQQHLQALSLLQFFEETTLSLYTFDHPVKPAVYDTRLRSVQNDGLDECLGIFGVLKLLSLQLSFHGMERDPVTGVLLVYPDFVSCYNDPKARRPSSVKFP